MTPTPDIRRARIKDARALSDMTRILIETGLPPSWTNKRVARLLSRHDSNGYCLISEGQLAGFSISTFGNRRIHLVLHAIAPGFRRKGYGSMLLNWQLQAAVAGGLTQCTLEVRANDAGAIAFYQSCGFIVVTRLRNYYSACEDGLVMKCQPIHLSLIRQ